MHFPTILADAPLILTECAISERIRRADNVEIHPTLFLAPLVYDTLGAIKMANIYSQYRTIACSASLPLLLCAPTWRIDKTRLTEAGFDDSLLYDAIQFMRDLQGNWQNDLSPLILGGLLGPKNDCYSPEEALHESEAEKFHGWQIERLNNAGVDCIVAQTIPAVSEGLGIAKAIASSGIPYIISFVINQNAEVLDGTDLFKAIRSIDAKVAIPPLGYMVNCIYPTFLRAEHQPKKLFERLIGIQANSSSLDHAQLDGSTILHQDDLQHWGEHMLHLNSEYGIKILGGCCGTDDTYLQYLVDHRTLG